MSNEQKEVPLWVYNHCLQELHQHFQKLGLLCPTFEYAFVPFHSIKDDTPQEIHSHAAQEIHQGVWHASSKGLDTIVQSHCQSNAVIPIFMGTSKKLAQGKCARHYLHWIRQHHIVISPILAAQLDPLEYCTYTLCLNASPLPLLWGGELKEVGVDISWSVCDPLDESHHGSRDGSKLFTQAAISYPSSDNRKRWIFLYDQKEKFASHLQQLQAHDIQIVMFASDNDVKYFPELFPSSLQRHDVRKDVLAVGKYCNTISLVHSVRYILGKALISKTPNRLAEYASAPQAFAEHAEHALAAFETVCLGAVAAWELYQHFYRLSFSHLLFQRMLLIPTYIVYSHFVYSHFLPCSAKQTITAIANMPVDTSSVDISSVGTSDQDSLVETSNQNSWINADKVRKWQSGESFSARDLETFLKELYPKEIISFVQLLQHRRPPIEAVFPLLEAHPNWFLEILLKHFIERESIIQAVLLHLPPSPHALRWMNEFLTFIEARTKVHDFIILANVVLQSSMMFLEYKQFREQHPTHPFYTRLPSNPDMDIECNLRGLTSWQRRTMLHRLFQIGQVANVHPHLMRVFGVHIKSFGVTLCMYPSTATSLASFSSLQDKLSGYRRLRLLAELSSLLVCLHAANVRYAHICLNTLFLDVGETRLFFKLLPSASGVDHLCPCGVNLGTICPKDDIRALGTLGKEWIDSWEQHPLLMNCVQENISDVSDVLWKLVESCQVTNHLE